MSEQRYDLESLSDGIARMPRTLTTRERFADRVFFFLQMISWFAFIFGGIVGYAITGWTGCVVLLVAGWLFGMWMRRSIGLRGRDPFHGFYRRMKERAGGSRRGILEWLIESLRGRGFTRSQCQRIWAAYERAMALGRTASTSKQQRQILQQLDEETKSISYATEEKR